ncbi:hypothetical protein M413DRAFT_13896 [Hebeloma cylindrosporum]|uniref:Aminoglycoside phosphotransferase domain-containing protein n=1 Tax=Hebeloma cylindrosporum TaxID=76867 RepID=A0A0C3BYM6_HEBCY|nr:hypothetical protein M413DRAFT_13896 [Hebeloma cylindrosporum h7]
MEASIAKLSKHQISAFFSKNSSAMQEQCDQEAERLTGTSVHPAPVQGGTSYTVVSDDETSVVQFRSGSHALDIDLLRCVEQAYMGFTPRHQFVGYLGELYVYRMGNVGGISMYLARDQLCKNDFSLLRRAVSYFAQFFASAWHNTPSRMQHPSRASLHDEYSSQLSQLQQGLPVRFRPTLDHLISKLPGLFENSWPLVPNHTDLLENNIHVNTETGRMTGICDWKDTAIGPFGVSLGGLETMLGIRTMEEGWRYHVKQQELRDLFWDSFYLAMGNVSEEQKELIEVARLVGLFLDNGFVWNDAGIKVPAGEINDIYDNLHYLEMVTLKLWAQGDRQSGDSFK